MFVEKEVALSGWACSWRGLPATLTTGDFKHEFRFAPLGHRVGHDLGHSPGDKLEIELRIHSRAIYARLGPANL